METKEYIERYAKNQTQKEERKPRQPDLKGSIEIAGWDNGDGTFNLKIGNAIFVRMEKYEPKKQ